jgi:hypothetical protein
LEISSEYQTDHHQIVRLLSVAFRRAVLLFESDEEQMEFMEDRVLDQQMAQFLIYKKQFDKAADIYLAEDDTLRAIETLLDPEYLEGVGRARELLIKELWRLFPMQCDKELPTSGHQLIVLSSKIKFDEIEGKEVFSVARVFRVIYSLL